MATTAAPGTAAPLGSFTVPVILPPTCPKRMLAQKQVIQQTKVFLCMEVLYVNPGVPGRQENGYSPRLFCVSDGLGQAFDLEC